MKKLAKYVLLSIALLTPVAALAASAAGDDCDCPCCPCPCCPTKTKP